MPLIDETQTRRPLPHTTPRENLSRSIRCGAVRLTAITTAPLLLAHPPQGLIASDAGVVDHDVDTAVLVEQMLGDSRRGVIIGDIWRSARTRPAQRSRCEARRPLPAHPVPPRGRLPRSAP